VEGQAFCIQPNEMLTMVSAIRHASKMGIVILHLFISIPSFSLKNISNKQKSCKQSIVMLDCNWLACLQGPYSFASLSCGKFALKNDTEHVIYISL
jgi:hypothetical protein